MESRAQNEVIYMWSGAITSSSVKVNAKLTNNTSQARLVVSQSPDLSSPIYGPYAAADASTNRMAALSAGGLQPTTGYYYAIEADGIVDNSADDIGRISTIKTGQYSFRFVSGSCAANSNHPVYTKMGEKSPLLMIVSGDFHYANPNSAIDVNVHRNPYEANMLSQPASRAFFKNVPLAYVWDDHDYSGNDSDSSAIGRANARQAYREYVPYYPLPAGGGNEPIYQAFTIGRIRFIMTDLRSVRGPGNAGSTSPTISMMGTLQKQWFKDQCRLARDQNLAIAWVNSVSFGGDEVDNWGGYRAEREELSNFFKAEGIRNMFMLSGDAHMLAIDDGSNHDFTTAGDNPNHYPVFATAALNQGGSDKGGTFSEGLFPNPNNTFGQYGMIDVTDNGTDKIQVAFTGYRVAIDASETMLATFNFEMTTGFVLPVRLTNLTATSVNNTVKVGWDASGLEDCEKFEVLHSRDGIAFKSIGAIVCNGGVPEQRYSFVHQNPVSGLNYYRIRIVEKSGEELLTEIVRVQRGSSKGISLMTNPVANMLQVNFEIPVSGNTTFSILSLQGQELVKGTIASGTTRFSYPVRRLAKGSYFFVVQYDSGQQRLQFVVK
jgi:alkaline phosphatase D